MLILQVLQGPERGKKFELPENEPQLIGRSSEALPVADQTMSRRHAELTPDEGKWFLRDLDSSNGTFVNGREIHDRCELSPGDQVRCGSTLFVFTRVEKDERERVIDLIPAEAFDTTIESTTGKSQNDKSMILASPDPLRAAMDHLRVIYELTAVTSGAFDRQGLLEKVMDLIFAEFRPDRGFILLQETAEDRPEPAVVRYREKPRNLDEGRIPVSRTIVQHTLSKGEGVLSTNAMNDKRFSAGDSVQDYGIRSAICVPLATAGRTFGVINIDSQLANFTFTEPQLRLLTAIGQHAGLAMANLELITNRLQTERLAATGEAVASLSHSIKNILQGLRGGADAVELAINRGDLKLAEEGWPILSRNLDRILALTMNMLTYSKPPALDIEETSLPRIIDEVAELIQPQCDRKNAGLILDVDRDVPPIPVDAAALHQALMNVVTNAVEAAPSKTGVVTMTLSFDPQKREAVITVGDNGPGVPEHMQGRAFEPFISSKGQRGTGLGLAVTRKIIREHGGRIQLTSKPNEGATVTIHLSSESIAVDPSATRLPRPMAQPPTDDDQFE